MRWGCSMGRVAGRMNTPFMVDDGVAVALQHHDQRETAEERSLSDAVTGCGRSSTSKTNTPTKPYERKAQEQCCAQRRTGERAPEGRRLMAVFVRCHHQNAASNGTWHTDSSSWCTAVTGIGVERCRQQPRASALGSHRSLEQAIHEVDGEDEYGGLHQTDDHISTPGS